MKSILKWLSLGLITGVFCICFGTQSLKSEQILLEQTQQIVAVRSDERPDFLPNKALLPTDFKVYIGSGFVVNAPYPGLEPKILPTVNEFKGVPGCYVACYSRQSENSIYSIGGGINVIGQFRVPGFYEDRSCRPKGYENSDISAERSFKQLCARNLPNTCKGESCWGGDDTGGWFGLLIGARKEERERLMAEGWEQLNTGKFQAALQSYQNALAIYREVKDRWGEGGALGGIGNVYSNLGDYVKAIQYQKQYLEIAQQTGNRTGQGYSLQSLGNAYFMLGDYNKAIDYYQRSLVIAEEIDDRFGEGDALGGLGNSYHNKEEYPTAIEYHKKSLGIKNNSGDRRGLAASLNNLGNAYYKLKNYSKAIEYLKQSLDIQQEIKDPRGEAIALNNLGDTYEKLGEYSKAIDYYQQSLAIKQQIGYLDGKSYTLTGLGVALFKAGNLIEAEKNLHEAIKIRESIRAELGSNDALKISIADTEISTSSYRYLQQVLIAQNKPEIALEIAERGRARAFVELLSKHLSNTTGKLSTNQPIAIEQIKQIAKAQNATLVEYSIVSDEQLYVWVIKPTGEVAFRRSNLSILDAELTEIVSAVRCFDNPACQQAITSRGEFAPFNLVIAAQTAQTEPPSQPQLKNHYLQQLHQLLIEPIADLLPTDAGAHVIFIPQQQLLFVPFPALQDKQGKYLIEKHTILTVPAIQVLELTRQQWEKVRQAAPKNVIVLGNPTMPSVQPTFDQPPQQLPSLPGAEKEAEAIAPLLNTKAIIGNQATKASIEKLMPTARIIHLATHGFLDDVQGLGSAIALAPSGQDNGLLTAKEILTLKLNAELVVLSACNTGRGRITGDGVVGLSRSLISAGVSSVIVSLWAVPDAPTASLMTEFYRHLQQNSDKAQALRSAMLTTMKKHPNPRDWAAFTLIGEAS